MVQTFTVACVQTTAGPDVKTNIINASALVHEAHKSGATLIVLPEMTNIIDMDRSAMAEKLSAEVDDISLVAFCTLAVELKVWLLLGSLGLKHEMALNAEGKPKFANRSFLIGDDGDALCDATRSSLRAIACVRKGAGSVVVSGVVCRRGDGHRTRWCAMRACFRECTRLALTIPSNGVEV